MNLIANCILIESGIILVEDIVKKMLPPTLFSSILANLLKLKEEAIKEETSPNELISVPLINKFTKRLNQIMINTPIWFYPDVDILMTNENLFDAGAEFDSNGQEVIEDEYVKLSSFPSTSKKLIFLDFVWPTIERIKRTLNNKQKIIPVIQMNLEHELVHLVQDTKALKKVDQYYTKPPKSSRKEPYDYFKKIDEDTLYYGDKEEPMAYARLVISAIKNNEQHTALFFTKIYLDYGKRVASAKNEYLKRLYQYALHHKIDKSIIKKLVQDASNFNDPRDLI